ncbi:flagellar biosynthetic protein FliO [Nitratiruptor tergarcus]|uniref:Flagellar biosynthesis protein, FliO n=1 Tax=Nitratiruptor tergarcus DSM 16512 TaxID=1069081 RepID=A0A1W1WSM1_9BACT|nr:flagellar biosynthetic protein FliO [Nitratiruptor tergarcus]SMC09297.1 Flagellar biosynthesis protein, FliO [Nitratiruptor tergarcus DSM 16512]
MQDSYAIIKFLATFSLIIIFLYALYYYFNNNFPKLSKQNREIKIKETKILGRNRYIYLVEIKDDIILLASDENGIRVLKEWKKERESV